MLNVDGFSGVLDKFYIFHQQILGGNPLVWSALEWFDHVKMLWSTPECWPTQDFLMSHEIL